MQPLETKGKDAAGGPPPTATAARAGLLLALLFITAVWGMTFIMVKEAVNTMPPLTFLAVRFLLASALLAPGLLLARSRRDGAAGPPAPPADDRRPARHTATSHLARDLWAGAQVGVFLCLGYAFQTLGLRWTGAADAAFITGTSVVMVPALSPWLGGRRASAFTWAGVAVTAAGLALLTLGGTAQRLGGAPAVPSPALAAPSAAPAAVPVAPATAAVATPVAQAASAAGPFGAFTPLVGDGLVLLCALAFALQILAVGRRAGRCHVLPLTLGQTLTTALLCGILAVGLERHLWRPLTPQVWLALGVTAVLATALALVVQVFAQRVVSPTEAALVFSTEPVFAAVFAWLYAGEVLGPLGLAGGAMILGGMLWAEMAPGRRRPDPTVRGCAPGTTGGR